MTKSRKTRTRLHATEFATSLASRYGCGRSFDPVECWHADGEGINKVQVLRVRGSCDYWYTDYSYADTTDGNSISSRYLFPTKTHKKPQMTEQSDCYGVFHDWTADPKR